MYMKFDDYLILEKINMGASSVEKYKLFKDDKCYLLRIFDARFMNSRYKALENMEILLKNGVDVPKVYTKGLLNEKKGYALLEWVDGVALDKVMLDIETEIQYGKYAASELQKMHSVKVVKQTLIYEKFLLSFNKKFDKVSKLEIEQKNISLVHDFVMEYKNILKELEQNCIIHGDFHPGNIINVGNRLVFIDMDVCTVSHPWEDLTSNACNMEFPNFYSSVITNYFENNVPLKFWTVYNLFGTLYTLDYILYTLRIKGMSLSDGEKKLKEFLNFTNYFQKNVPNWFNKEINVRRKYK